MAETEFKDFLEPTTILDYRTGAVARAFRVSGLEELAGEALLRAAHSWIVRQTAPIYTLDELQPISRTLRKQEGSCSQRLAVLEGLARRGGIPTRVRALWIEGRFWALRFPFLRPFLPSEVLLSWPEFWIDCGWRGVETLFGDLEDLARLDPSGFSNRQESLFEALSHTAVDFRGATAHCQGGSCDLSRFLIRESGIFRSRDELFERLGSIQDSCQGRIFERIWGGRRCAG